MRPLYILFILFSQNIAHAFAQTWETGLFAGASGYIGDVNPVRIYKVTDPAFGASLRYNYDGYWSVSLNILQGRIGGNDADAKSAYQKARNLNFQSLIREISLQGEFNFFKYLPGIKRLRDNHKITPFIFTGVGMVFFSPKAKYSTIEYDLPSSKTEGDTYPLSAIAIPYGAGIKYNIQNSWTLSFQVGYRTAFTPYLDDIYGSYSGPSKIPGDPSANHIGVSGTQRGNFFKSETYMFVGFGLAYRFITNKCFKF